MTVLITLTTAGSNSGPFDLYSSSDGFVTPFETNVSKLDLESGYSSSLVPDYAAVIRIQSVGEDCSNYVDIPVDSFTTTTTSSSSSTTTTTTTLATVSYCYTGRWSNDDPIHPDGGEIQYVNAYGETVIISSIFFGDTVTFEASSILLTVGVNVCT